jgi:elongation factor P
MDGSHPSAGPWLRKDPPPVERAGVETPQLSSEHLMYDTTDFRKNLKIEIEGEPYVIVAAQFVKPGKGVAIMKTRMKSLLTGRVLERNFRSGDKVGRPNLVEREMQYLYADGEHWVFMDNNNFEQVHLPKEAVEDALPFLIDNMACNILFFDNKAISIDLPTFVELLITQSDPGVKGDTAQGATKPATLETGYTLQVPLFVEEGERIKVDTRTGDFVERVKA